MSQIRTTEERQWLASAQGLGYDPNLAEIANHLAALTSTLAAAIVTAIGTGRMIFQTLRKLWVTN